MHPAEGRNLGNEAGGEGQDSRGGWVRPAGLSLLPKALPAGPREITGKKRVFGSANMGFILKHG